MRDVVVPLRRLLSASSAAALMAPYARLDDAVRLRLLDAAGALHAEARGSRWRPGGAIARWPLVVAGVEVGRLEADPAPGDGRAEAAADALRDALGRALDAGHGQRTMAAETLERYREIHLLFRVGDALAGTLDPAAVPRRVLAEAGGVITGAGGGVWLAAAEDAPADAAAGDAWVTTGEAPSDATRAALLERLGDAATPAIAAADPAAVPGTTLAAHHLLWAPLRAREAWLGGVWLVRPGGAEVFTAGDLKLLTALATQAGAFLDNARLHQRALAQERLEQELRLAYDVQARLMPRSVPRVAGWDVAGFWRPAREVSGDFYDLLARDDGLGVVIADVADKGMPAALFMAVTRSLLRAAAAGDRSPARVIADTNRLAALDAHDGMFVTLWYGQLAPDGGVRYVNAGHNPPLLLRADGRVERLGRTGILVGWDADAAFGEAEVALGPGDVVLGFTDGVSEARGPDGEEYGEDRLVAALRAHRALDAQALIEALRADLDAFVAGAPAHDDCTLVVARYGTPAHLG